VMVANPRACPSFRSRPDEAQQNDQIDAGVLNSLPCICPLNPGSGPRGHAGLGTRGAALGSWWDADGGENRQHAAGLSKAIPAVVRRDLARSLRAQNGPSSV